MEGDPTTTHADETAFERELTMARGATRMVADGVSPSMTLGGLGHGQEVLEALEAEAEQRGVELVRLPRQGDREADLRVRRRSEVLARAPH